MNFSAIEDSVLEEKKRLNNFLSHFLKNSRILIILLIAAVITAISVSVWIKVPEYEVLYSNLSNEDGRAIINQLDQMKMPYKFTENSGQLLVPKSKIYEIRLHLSENNLPRGGGVGFELLDKAKFGVSQFNEQVNYQRALEGELARTIQRINTIKSARIHIALPKSSLFLQDKKQPSASVILDVQLGKVLDTNQINSILHLISSSISDLSVENITIVDQFGKLLNSPSLGYDQINDLQFKYSEGIEFRYRNRIKSILEPLFGIGNVEAQVTAQIDFNAQEKTQEKYLPNTNYKNQSIRSHQSSIHSQINKENIEAEIPNSLSSSQNTYSSNNIKGKNTTFENDQNSLKSNINRDNTINYELNHTVSHTKINIGEIKRLSAAVVINFIPNNKGKLVPLTLEEIKNIKLLIREAIGYSKHRGDSVHVVNAFFVKHNKKFSVKFNNLNKYQSSHVLFSFIPWFLIILFLFFLFRKYICPFLRNDIQKNNSIEYEKYNIAKAASQVDVEDTLQTDKLIHKICNISNQNPRTIALIIRQWMSDKI